MIRVLVNATTLVVGGGIQVGISFIEQAVKNNEFEWIFLVSSEIFKSLSVKNKNDTRIICIEVTPSKLISGFKSRKKIKKIADDFKPNLVYSIGFPSYIRFKYIEIGRYTNPWEINPEPLPWHTIPGFYNKLKIRLGIIYRIFWARKADFIETQTEAAKKGISKRVFFPIENIFVLPNTPNPIFVDAGNKINNIEKIFERDNIAFCIAAPYNHKNLDIIPYVANKLKFDYNFPIKFILTIPFDSLLWLTISEKAAALEVIDLIQNIGKIKVTDCIEYYNKSKIVFLPSLLEVFSATYIEAMAMKIPIITTDLDFAHDNCKEAALYYTPGNANDAASQIFKILNNKELFVNQIMNGTLVLDSYLSIEEKYLTLFNQFKTIIENGKK